MLREAAPREAAPREELMLREAAPREAAPRGELMLRPGGVPWVAQEVTKGRSALQVGATILRVSAGTSGSTVR